MTAQRFECSRRLASAPGPVRVSRAALLPLVALLLSACGFQLRGANVLPPALDDLYVQAPAELEREVRIFLDGSDTRIVAQRAGADVVLSISAPRYDRRVLTVDPNTGNKREFELSYAVDFTATHGDGRPILSGQSVRLQRDYVFDSDAIIGASREEGVLREEMVRDAVQQILYRLQAATKAG